MTARQHAIDLTLPTIEQLREFLNYDAQTGVLTWKAARKKVVKGSIAGRVNKDGYILVGILGKKYGAHRIAWAIHYGAWAPSIIDHKNCNKSDNRIDNLRLADKSKNVHNSGKWCTNTSGFKCVYWNSQRKKWMAKTTILGKIHYLGLYETKEDAHAAYAKFANDNLGEFARAI